MVAKSRTVTPAFESELDSWNFFVVRENVDTWVDSTAYQRPHNNSESCFLCLKVFE